MDLTPKVTMVLNVEREGKVPLTSLGEPSKFPQTGLTAKVTSAPGSAAALASEMDDSKRVMIEYISRKIEMVILLWLLFIPLCGGLAGMNQILYVEYSRGHIHARVSVYHPTTLLRR